MKVDMCETGVGWTEKRMLLMDCRDENRTMESGMVDVDHSTMAKGRTGATLASLRVPLTTSASCLLGKLKQAAPSQEVLLGDVDGTLGGITG
jgi:hypothetical protein